MALRRVAVSLTKCEYCAGPAKWTVGPAGDVWFYCTRQCDGFMQMELFPEEGVPCGTRGDDTDTLNSREPTLADGEGLPF